MRVNKIKSLCIGTAMVLTLVAALFLVPKHNLSALKPKVDLTTLIPDKFGDWAVDTSITPVEPSPDVQASLKKIYSQTLAKTYINRRGQRVMLSIAYGDGIDRQLDVHRPEYCYPAQGFSISAFVDTKLQDGKLTIPLRRLVATMGQRTEPISYWVTVGDKAVSSTFDRKMVKIRYGLTGQLGSGMLVRVSSIDMNTQNAYRVQDGFIRQMITALPPKDVQFLLGASH